MKLFNFFRKSRNSDFPEDYKGIIAPKDYFLVLDISRRYHSENGLNITHVEKGEIVVEVNGEQQHRYLDNLVRVLSSHSKSDWPKVIYEHFDKLKDHSSAYNYFFKDFDYSAQFLRVLIKSADLYKGELGHFVTRCDFPETNTFLVLEFEQQFQYVTKENITEWGKSTEELFDIAIRNTPGDEVQIKEYMYEDKYPVYVFFSGDYSAAMVLNFAITGADLGVGAYGSLIAIPTKGTAFVHPIESGDVLALIEILAPSVNKFHNEDPGNITTNFYWKYGSTIEKFPTGQDANGAYIRLPAALLEAFK